jgi:hypothetical protein
MMESESDAQRGLNFAWPQKGTSALRVGNYTRHPRFSDHPSARNDHMWNGFWDAGAVLARACRESDGASCYSHELVWPILYNYRHGLELAMKDILHHYGEHAGHTGPFITHDLRALWSATRETIATIAGSADQEATDAVEAVIGEFHAFDRGSVAFRYATDANGFVIQLPRDALDLDHLAAVMEGVKNYFVGVDGELEHRTAGHV